MSFSKFGETCMNQSATNLVAVPTHILARSHRPCRFRSILAGTLAGVSICWLSAQAAHRRKPEPASQTQPHTEDVRPGEKYLTDADFDAASSGPGLAGMTADQIVARLGQPRTIIRGDGYLLYYYLYWLRVPNPRSPSGRGYCSVRIRAGHWDGQAGPWFVEYTPHTVEDEQKRYESLSSDFGKFQAGYDKLSRGSGQSLVSPNRSEAAGQQSLGASTTALASELDSLDPVRAFRAADAVRSQIETFNPAESFFLIIHLIKCGTHTHLPEGKALYVVGPGVAFGRAEASLGGNLLEAIDAIGRSSPSLLTDAIRDPSMEPFERYVAALGLLRIGKADELAGIEDPGILHSFVRLSEIHGIQGPVFADTSLSMLNSVSALAGHFPELNGDLALAEMIMYPSEFASGDAVRSAKARLDADAGKSESSPEVHDARAVLRDALALHSEMESYAGFVLGASSGSGNEEERNDLVSDLKTRLSQTHGFRFQASGP